MRLFLLLGRKDPSECAKPASPGISPIGILGFGIGTFVLDTHTYKMCVHVCV